MEQQETIVKRIKKFLKIEPELIVPHESLTKKQAEQVFRENRIVKHVELGETILPVEMAEKVRKHKGFDTSSIIKQIPKLYKTSILIESQTEKEFNKQHKKHNNIAFWHNTLNKFKIKDELTKGFKYFIVRFTIEEDKIGKKNKRNTKGRQVLHSSFITNFTIEKGDIVMHTSKYLGRTISPDTILTHYLEIVNNNM